MKNAVLVPLAIQQPSDSASPPLHFIRETYLLKLCAHGLVPIFAATTMSPRDTYRLYNMTNGLLLLGGGDIDPGYYKQSRERETSGVELGRDHLELSVLWKSFQDQKPVLGICRGAQVIAVAAGGSLVQHLDSAKLRETHEAHTYQQALSNINEAVVVEGTHTHRILKKKRVRISCAHHQAIETPGQGTEMIVSAKTAGGVTEMIECRDPDFFCIGIQSHPELEGKGDLEPLFKAFAKAVRKYSK